MKRLILMSIITLLTPFLFAQDEGTKIDKIKIDGTWMTKDVVILKALDFEVGDTITKEDLDYATQDLYDLELFSKVELSWETDEEGAQVLVILAKDQLHIMPLAAIDGASNTINLGVLDGNFLGYNIDLSVSYEQEKEFANYDFIKRRIKGSFFLPDSSLNGFTFGQQVDVGVTENAEHYFGTNFSLPKDWFNSWQWNFNFSKQRSVNYNSEEGVKIDGYSIDNWNVSTSIAPDWRSLFSPSFALGWSSDTISDKGLRDVGFVGDEKNVSYLNMGTSVEYGDIQTRNSYFQKNGWSVFANYNLNVRTQGDSNSEPFYNNFGMGAEGHYLAFKWLEFASFLNIGITDSEEDFRRYDIKLHESRDRAVPGLHVQGSAYYSFQNQIHLTYLNTDWFAVEHVFWYDMAQGNKNAALFSQAPKQSVGTGVRFRIPNIPWLYLYVDVQWAIPPTGQDIWGIRI